MNSDAFKERLKLAIAGESNRSFSEKCDISEGTLRRYLLGETFPPLDTLEKIASAAKIRLAWLATGEGSMRQGEPEPGTKVDLEHEYVLVPRYEVLASAGGGAVVHSEQIVDYLSFKAEWVRNSLGVSTKDLALINVKGDSMEPTLSNEDLILVDLRAHQVEDNAIYVLQLDGALLVKRLQRMFDSSVIVSSDNSIYKPETIRGDAVKDLNVIGRVVWCGRRM